MGVSSDRLEVGRVARAHGLRGEVVVVAITDQLDRFATGSVLWVDDRAMTIASSRPHQERFLVRFAGIDDRTAAEALRGASVTAEPRSGPPPEGRWVHEVIGRDVVDRSGRRVGRVTAVQANPAHDLLVIDDRILVPFPFLVDDVADRDELVVDPPEGLLALYDEGPPS